MSEKSLVLEDSYININNRLLHIKEDDINGEVANASVTESNFDENEFSNRVVGLADNAEMSKKQKKSPPKKISKIKKRPRNEDNWKRNIRTRAVNQGYKMSHGNLIKRKVGERCLCKRKQCSDITDESRQQIFDNFWSETSTPTIRHGFIVAHTEKKAKIRGTVDPEYVRGDNICYFLPVNGKKINVCEKFFKLTLGISKKMIHYNLSRTHHGIRRPRPKKTPHVKLTDDISNEEQKSVSEEVSKEMNEINVKCTYLSEVEDGTNSEVVNTSVTKSNENEFSNTVAELANDAEISKNEKKPPSKKSFKVKKRPRNEDNWKKNIRTRAVNQGYKMFHGNLIKRKVGERCLCKRKQCSDITDESRQQIFDNFWSEASTSTIRHGFIVAHTEKKAKVRGTVDPEYVRGDNICYFLPVNGKKVNVCEKFFKQTLGISKKMIHYNLSRTHHGIRRPRPKKTPHAKLTDDNIKKIMDHI